MLERAASLEARSDTRHEIGEVVRGRYRIVRLLGRGGGGATYEAEDLAAEGAKVALERLEIRSVGESKKHELFEREAKVLRHLVHSAIPACAPTRSGSFAQGAAAFDGPPRHGRRRCPSP